MLKRIIHFFEEVPATIFGGIFLLASLFLPMFGVEIPIYLDPAWVPFVISGTPIIYSAFRKLRYNKGISKISSALLISTAMVAAVAIGDIFAAGEVAFIMAIGEILEEKTTAKAKKGLKELISLAPAKGRIIRDGKEEMIDSEKIAVGDIIRILPGESVPVDGVIQSGETSIDQSIMTGESLPVEKSVGDSVFCGTVNRFGAIDIRASKVGEDTGLQKLIRMVKEAEDKKAPMQRIADRWASYLVPVALLIAVIAGVVTRDIVVAVTVLVVFCPCALVLATPSAIMAAIGQAAKEGVIIKSGEALEKMGKIRTIALDKTGTLTFGRPEVTDIIPAEDSLSADTLLSLIASAESKSEHPLGKAIVNHAKAENALIRESQNFRMTAGRGISAQIDGRQIFCGSEKFIAENNIEIPEQLKKHIEELRDLGKALIIAAEGEKAIGVIALADKIKPNAKETVDELTTIGVKSVLLTGDNRKTADHFAEMVGITEIRSELLPEDKVKNITSIQSKGEKVCMIGDGVNDAPALKTADVGIAMGTMGSDIAIEAADIAIMCDDISKIPYLKKLSNLTVRTIKFGITLSLSINFLAIALSFLKLLNPTTGALVHNAGSILVILICIVTFNKKRR